jgi:hypothetical protein
MAELSYDGLAEASSFIVTNYVFQPSRDLTFMYLSLKDDGHVADGNVIIARDDFHIVNDQMTFRAPFYYPPDTPVLLTLETVRLNYDSSPETLAQLPLIWGGQTNLPVAGVGADVSYLVSVTGGQEYTLDESNFVWPTNTFYDASSTSTVHYLSFNDFHNQALLPEIIVEQDVLAGSGQVWQRRVINEKRKELRFTYKTSNKFDRFLVEWDFDGDGYNNDGGELREIINGSAVTHYTYENAFPAETLANRRKDLTVKLRVKDTKGKVVANSQTDLRVRVALLFVNGTAFSAGTPQQQLDVYRWKERPPRAFNDESNNGQATKVETNTRENINLKRLVYTAEFPPPPAYPVDTAGLTRFGFSTFGFLKVFGAVIGPNAWTDDREALEAIILHEKTHVDDYADRRDNSQSLMRRIYDNAKDSLGTTEAERTMFRFSDANAYSKQIAANNLSYRALVLMLPAFVDAYTTAVNDLPKLSGQTKSDARQFLKDIYLNVPFKELQDRSFTPHIVEPK